MLSTWACCKGSMVSCAGGMGLFAWLVVGVKEAWDIGIERVNEEGKETMEVSIVKDCHLL